MRISLWSNQNKFIPLESGKNHEVMGYDPKVLQSLNHHVGAGSTHHLIADQTVKFPRKYFPNI